MLHRLSVRVFVSTVLLLFLAVAAVDAPAARAARPERVQLANAGFQGMDASGCLQTFFGVVGRDAQSATGVSESGMLVTYSIDDVCTGQRVAFSQGIVALAADDFTVHRSRRSACLNAEASIPGDVPGTTRHVVIALEWSSDSKAVKESSIAGTDRIRSADVSGGVTVDGVTVVPGLPFTGANILWTVP